MDMHSPPGPGEYTRGIRAGCLFGCAPLLMIIFLVLIVVLGEWFSFTFPFREKEAPSALLPLPRIAPTSPVAALLPPPPPAGKTPVYLGEDLSRVPELMLEDAPQLTTDQWRSRKARVAAAALHLNEKEEDGFLKALRSSRPDLAGVPFAMGNACRTRGARAKAFKEAAEAVRRDKEALHLDEDSAADAWEERCRQRDQAHLAVVSQVIAAEDQSRQNALIRILASIPRPEATRALARLAVFSTDKASRASAIEALSVRREADATEVLVAGLSYPWPAVADHAATAIEQLKRTDLVPYLKAMLDAPDPRGPRTEIVDGRKETVAHELVRINHLRNCQLCHAPAERGQTPDETLVAEVPVPTMSLPDTSSGYGQTESSLLVRIDVTYLRQDFSAMQEVSDWTAAEWPAKQRFDFLVRRRVLTPGEAADLRRRLAGESPYRQTAARALCALTGGGFEDQADRGRGPLLMPGSSR